MFWRFGSLELSRPVAATPWLNEAWIRPSPGCTRSGSASRYVPLSLPSWRCRSSSAGSGCFGASSSRTSCAVLSSPPGVFDERRQLQLVEEHLAELRRRVDVERPARPAVDLRLDRRHLPGELLRELPQPRDVHRHAGRAPSAPAPRSTAARGRRTGPRAPRPGPWRRGSTRSARWRRRPRRRTRRPWRRRPGPSCAAPSPCRSGRVIGIIAWPSRRCESWSRLWLRSPLSSR